MNAHGQRPAHSPTQLSAAIVAATRRVLTGQEGALVPNYLVALNEVRALSCKRAVPICG